MVQETTLVVDEQLLEAMGLEVESSIPAAQLGICKDINTVRRLTLPYIVGDVTEALYVSPTISQHSVEWLTFLEVALRKQPNVDPSPTIPEVAGMRSTHTVTPPLLFLFSA